MNRLFGKTFAYFDQSEETDKKQTMKIHLILFFALVSSVGLAQDATDKERPLTIAEQMPAYVGGMEKMFAFINTNLVVPDFERKPTTTGNCYVTFVVEKDGSLSNITILKSVIDCPACDAEAIRVVSAMPNWIPGKQNGNVVRVQYNLPIKFVNK
ncbi:MAG TPA: energy transducer TonB [Bacteroidia bacterium]|jgi:protein TonB